MRRSDDEFQNICTLIGLMTFSWAWAENTLAATIGIINGIAGPIKGHEREPPLSLKRRIKCFRAAFRDIALLEPLKDDSAAVAKRFVELGRRRHDFVHGAVWQLQKGTFQSTAFGVKAGQYTLKNKSFNKADAVSLNVEIGQLSDDSTAFMLRVTALFQAAYPPK